MEIELIRIGKNFIQIFVGLWEIVLVNGQNSVCFFIDRGFVNGRWGTGFAIKELVILFFVLFDDIFLW